MFLHVSPCFSIHVNIFSHLYRIYQERDESIHSHPKLKNKNGKLYNDKSGGIVRTKKAYAVRDMQWTPKYRTSCRLATDVGETAPDEIGQHAANVVEKKHSHIICTFPQHKLYPVHWGYIPVAQLKIIFALNIKNTESLFEKFNQNSDRFNNMHLEIMSSLNEIHQKYLTLRKLMEKADEFGHVYCWWPELDRTLETWFKGNSQDECVKGVSRLLSSDYTELFRVVYQEIDFDGDIDELLPNKMKIQEIQRKIKYRMTQEEIKTILYKEWMSPQDAALNEIFSDIDDDDDDESETEAKIRLEIPKNAKKAEKQLCFFM